MTPLRGLALIVACTVLIFAYLLTQAMVPAAGWDARMPVATLLCVSAALLLACVGFTLFRLHVHMRALEARLSFEKLIGAISTRFIDLPKDRFDQGIEAGLARLAEHAAADHAIIITPGPHSDSIGRSYRWPRDGLGTPAMLLTDLFLTATGWCVSGYERHGCIHVPRVAALPSSVEKARLEKFGIRSWLSIQIGQPGKRVGFLMLATTATEARWPDAEIARMCAAGEIFATAIAHGRSRIESEAEARLRQAQRLEAIGTVAGGIAHEFNNILGAVLGYGEMALAALRKNSRAHHHVLQIMKAGKRAQDVIDQIFAFSCRRSRQRRPMRAQPTIAEAIELLRTSFPPTLNIEMHLRADSAMVLSNPAELRQVVTNLCTNAAEAMDFRGSVAISLSIVEVDGCLPLSHGTLPAGRYIRFAVKDTGRGIGAAAMDRIFEPFFTTKSAADGTGLGLSTVHGIVMQQGGAMNVESRPGRGTTFEAYFPQIEGELVEADPTPDAQARRGHGETILFVDNEKQLVLLGEEMLAALGYEPVGFDTCSAALAALRADPNRFDLVLADEIMPEMSGTELARALHSIRPELPVVLMTGYGGPIRSDRLQSAAIRDVLQKPLSSAALSLCLVRHLPARKDLPKASTE
jgi:signal transduction histidine kinase/ActR/RegA family two-component response regulator